MLQTLRRDFESICVLALPHEHMHRSRGRLRDDRQSRAADFLNPILQLLRCKPHRAQRLFCDDDLRTSVAVFDEKGVGGVERFG